VPAEKPPDVLFDDLYAGTTSFISSTELRAITPVHAPGTASVTVYQQNGVFTAPNAFTFRANPFKMTPSSGPISGGTVVTFTGDFGSWPYDVIFGQTFVPGYRVDKNTVVAVTPPAAGPEDKQIPAPV